MSFNVLTAKKTQKEYSQVASVNTLCKSVLNVKNTVIKNSNLYSDKNGVKHIRIQARPNKWHENDCPFCHKSCPVYDKHSSRPTIWRGLERVGILSSKKHHIISINTYSSCLHQIIMFLIKKVKIRNRLFCCVFYCCFFLIYVRI